MPDPQDNIKSRTIKQTREAYSENVVQSTKNTLSKNNKLKTCATSENVTRSYSATSIPLVLCPSELHTYNVDMGDVCVDNVKKFSDTELVISVEVKLNTRLLHIYVLS